MEGECLFMSMNQIPSWGDNDCGWSKQMFIGKLISFHWYHNYRIISMDMIYMIVSDSIPMQIKLN